MELTFKQYNTIRIIIVFVLALIIGQSMVFRNFFIPVILIAVSSLLLMYLRKKVKGVLADERDYAVGGKAALLAIQVWSWIAVVAMFILLALSDTNPFYTPVAMTLSFSVCILMLIYSVIFKYYNKVKFTDKKLIFSALVLILFIVLAVIGIRAFSGEDNWICKDGQWIEHGHPSSPVPNINCD